MADALLLLPSRFAASPSPSRTFHLASISTSTSASTCHSSSPRRLAAASIVYRRSRQLSRFKVYSAIVEDAEQKKWWEREAGPNMIEIHSTEEFLNALRDAGERLVIVDFFGTWCASCRALFPKLCKIVQEHPDILFLKVDFDANKPMCKSLNVKVLPYFHFYRGADGQLEAFSCSLAKLQKLKDAIATHNTARCSIGPPVGVGDLNLLPSSQGKPAEIASSQEKTAEASSR